MTEEKAIEIMKDWIVFQKAHKEKINKADELIEIQETILKALEQKDKELAEERIKYISSNLNNTIKQKQKEDEQLNALNEGWKIELEQKDKEIQELKEDNQHQWDERCKLTFELEKQEKEM
ncbi:hypothetical protein IJD44_07805 [bacterium]|nr:hypothetical protein [bacterium]